MTWVTAEGFQRRPLVIVEDHLYHTTELLERLGGPRPLHAHLTVVCLDRPGPDTTRTAAGWLAACPDLQVMAAVEQESAGAARAGIPPGPAAGTGDPGAAMAARFQPLPAAAFTSPHRLCQALAAALRPGGMLLQDVQLETLAFIPADRWWESIHVASAVRGMFAERPPACRFFSNKRGYEATFGRDLLDAGFDPRDVIDKAELDRAVVPTLRGFLDRAFPLALRVATPGHPSRELRAARDPGERNEIEGQLDLLLWSAGNGAWELGGRAIAGPGTGTDPAGRRGAPLSDGPPPATPATHPQPATHPPTMTHAQTATHAPPRRRLVFKAGNQEAVTWRALVADCLAAGPGLPVLEVGGRLAPAGAGKPEITNVAARHVHALRGRLADPAAIVTAGHAYRLSERLAVGQAQEAGAGARE